MKIAHVRRTNNPRRRSPHMEMLEDRRLMAVDILSDIPMITEHDVATGEEISYAAPDNDPLMEFDREVRLAGYDGLIDFLKIGSPNGPYDPMQINPEMDSILGGGPDTIFGPDGRTRVTPTTGYPWRTVGLMLSNWASGGAWCSGAMLGPFHVLTAAHCIRNETDHPTNPNQFASNTEFVAGSDGERWSTVLYPDSGTQSTNRPYGVANATYYRAYQWNNTSWDYDIALVTLDRRVGNFTGWMGYGWNSSNSFFDGMTMNSAGYPGDRNDTNGDGIRDTQYMFHMADPVTSVTSHQLRSNQIDIMPGNSGGPLWRYVSATDERTIYGVASHHNASYNAWTRITEDKYDNLIIAGMNADAIERPPTDRADLVDWDRWHNSTTQFMSSNTIIPGTNFSVTTYPRNNGTAASGGYTVSFYASTNTTISGSDFFLGSVGMGSLSSFNWDTATLNTVFPSIPAGNYYVGWILDSGNSVAEFVEGNNTGFLPNQLTVVSDDHGNSAGTATAIGAHSTTAGDIQAPGDRDWFSFRADAGAQITLATTLGTLSDSVLRLYASDGTTEIAFDDDGGPGLASLIDFTIPSRGFYYVSVADFGDNGTGSYSLSLDHIDDHGGSAGSSTLIGVNSTALGSTEVGLDADYFRFTATAGTSYVIETNLITHPDTTLTLYDVNGTTQLAFNDDHGGTFASRIDWVAPASGQYYIGVRGFSSNVGTYQLELQAQTTPTGDFNNDGLFNTLDIDALVSVIAAGSHNVAFDMTGDGFVNLADRDAWLAVAGGINLGPGRVYRLGDANLDGAVDGSDYNLWNQNKFTNVAAWSRGDFTADGSIDGSDYNLWNQNKFTSADLAGRTGGVPLADQRKRFEYATRKPPVTYLEDEATDRAFLELVESSHWTI